MPLKSQRGCLGFMVAVMTIAMMLTACAPVTDHDALWKIVNGKCVPDEAGNSNPAPCAAVDTIHGYAVLKDIRGETQYLLIPTARITGIEDSALAAPEAENYFADAWAARRFVAARLERDLPREDIALAVNSLPGRSQNQLHIHIDCISADARDALAAHQEDIKADWTPFPEKLAGHSYRARRVEGADLAANPFRLLAEDTGVSDPGEHTLVIAGMVFTGGRPGFAVLDGEADPASGNRGSGEELQDHSCSALR